MSYYPTELAKVDVSKEHLERVESYERRKEYFRRRKESYQRCRTENSEKKKRLVNRSVKLPQYTDFISTYSRFLDHLASVCESILSTPSVDTDHSEHTLSTLENELSSLESLRASLKLSDLSESVSQCDTSIVELKRRTFLDEVKGGDLSIEDSKRFMNVIPESELTSSGSKFVLSELHDASELETSISDVLDSAGRVESSLSSVRERKSSLDSESSLFEEEQNILQEKRSDHIKCLYSTLQDFCSAWGECYSGDSLSRLSLDRSFSFLESASVSSRIDRLSKVNSQRDSIIESISASESSLSENVSDAERRVRDLRSSVSSLEARHSSLCSSVSSLERENESLFQSVSELEYSLFEAMHT